LGERRIFLKGFFERAREQKVLEMTDEMSISKVI
jgi:hypothetical protein